MVTDDNRGNEEIAMVTKLVSNDNKKKSFKLPLSYIFLEDTNLTILTRKKKKDLY
jgi:hypothetical protein